MYAPNINITNQYFMSLMIVLKKEPGNYPSHWDSSSRKQNLLYRGFAYTSPLTMQC